MDYKTLYYDRLRESKAFTFEKRTRHLQHLVNKTELEQIVRTSLSKSDTAVNFNSPTNIYIQCAIDNIMRRIEHYLKTKGGLKVNSHPVGSSVDGSKINSLDEFDYMWDVDLEKGYHFQRLNDGLTYKLFQGDDEIPPADSIKQFSLKIFKAVESLQDGDLKGLQHGGFAHPDFSGVRIIGPSATILIFRDDSLHSESLLSIDNVLSHKMPLDHQEPLLSSIREKLHGLHNRNNLFHSLGLFLIPDPVMNVWKVSTAGIEANILPKMHDCAAKQALALIKKICSRVSESNFNNENISKQIPLHHEDVVAKDFFYQYWEYQTQVYSCHKGEYKTRQVLVTQMMYSHMFLDYEDASSTYELAKYGISVNSAAIKHAILNISLDDKINFSSKNIRDVHNLVIKVLKKLLGSSVQHALIDDQLHPFTFASYIASTGRDDLYQLSRMQYEFIIKFLELNPLPCSPVCSPSAKRRKTTRESDVKTKTISSSDTYAIKTANANKVSQICALKGKLMNVTHTVRHSQSNEDLFVDFHMTDADATAIVRIFIRKQPHMDVSKGNSYLFSGLKKASVGLFHVTPQTVCARVSPILMPIEVSENLEPNPFNARSLDDAKHSIGKSTVKGKVIMVGSERCVPNTPRLKRCLALVDKENQTPVKLAVFDEHTKRLYRRGDVLRITNVKKHEYCGQLSLVTCNSNIQRLNDPWLASLTENPDYIPNDEDLMTFSEHELLGVTSISLYKGCQNRVCARKRMTENCSKCQINKKFKLFLRADCLFQRIVWRDYVTYRFSERP